LIKNYNDLRFALEMKTAEQFRKYKRDLNGFIW
jgi:hypothetical protein